ncbi:DNA polymerase-3 subunit gamma/tau [Duganella sp. CF402]|uniref:DNA polymerase III subunit gamma/tau n=1 Tax=unclassified Duganella TaxID=2636909 RepID=UPI0008C553A9|nr:MULTISPECIES: DNA polymerase III subunit gamma/tau [unclassified Duganella]RZT11422.1 DNA polymerase III gamma subunit /DNA polymerase III tau subunit [Duganella sp. BK701]SEK65209.1 DNA polymerase-3 subunit gamma/tau [Duganella sp. CF402]
MSYQVLARKYRPRNFETLVGQEHVVRALTHALHSGRLHHAYLFTGTRGVGKTTLSRILAKSLNCVGPDGNGGITATPCGVCEACTAIDAGRFVDYIEMDAASNRGVDEMAQLLEQAVYAPTNARFKVYMIDEVHMLTNHAFNSMLKTLEEPPEHVKFILATTDPQKIPVTVLSRCLQFNLKQMPPGHIIGHLENILGQEGITFEQPALRLLATGAHGSMRDALSLTDQAIAYAAGAVTLDAVQGMLGALDQSYLIRLLDALAAQDGADLLAVADEMATRSLSYNGALQDLGTLLHRIALAQTVPAALPEDLPEYADIVRLAGLFDAEEVQLYYQIAVHGRNELGLAPDEYAGFSMTLLRMLAFRPGVGGAEGQAAAAPAVSRQAAMASARAAAGAAPARAAANVQASHASVVPPSVIAGAAAMAREAASPVAVAAQAPVAPQPAAAPSPAAVVQPPVSAAPAPSAPPPAPPAAAPAPAAPISTARAAINAALEAARAASRPGGARPAASAPVAAPAPEAPSSPPSVSAASTAPVPSAPQAVAPQAPAAVQTPAAAPARPAPWEDMPPAADGGAAVLEAPARVAPPAAAPQYVAPAPQAKAKPPVAEDDDLPPWVTEFSDDSAMPAQGAAHPYAPEPATQSQSAPAQQANDPHAIAMPARAAPAPAKAPYAYVITPVPELNWDGNWPAVAAALPLRGTAQQLAMQAEMVKCYFEGNAFVIALRVPIETWRTPGNIEKLTTALTERFSRTVRVDSELGAVWYTASAEAQAYREACQRAAEETIANDPFVNSMIRELDAWVVPSSIVPPQTSAAAAA